MGSEAKKKKLLRTMEEYNALQVAIMMMLTIIMLMVIVMGISLQASAPPGVSPYVYWTPELCAERLLHVMLHCQVQISTNSNHDRGKDDNHGDGQPPGGGQWQAVGLCWTCCPSVETRNPPLSIRRWTICTETCQQNIHSDNKLLRQLESKTTFCSVLILLMYCCGPKAKG